MPESSQLQETQIMLIVLIVLVVLCLCVLILPVCLIAVLALMGPIIGDVFSNVIDTIGMLPEYMYLLV